MGPGWKPDYLGGKHPIPEINPQTYKKYDAENTTRLKVYAGIVYVLSLPVFLVLQQTKGLPLANQVILAVPVVVGLATAGGLMMRKKWGFILEFIRVPVFTFVVFAVVSVLRKDIMLTVTGIVAGIGVIQLIWLTREYLRAGKLRFT